MMKMLRTIAVAVAVGAIVSAWLIQIGWRHARGGGWRPMANIGSRQRNRKLRIGGAA